jgi:hypothetical protein
MLVGCIAALTVFACGSVLACSGNYCLTNVDYNCIVVDVAAGESCCLNIGSTGPKCWTCDREEFLCGVELRPELGAPYNCHSPGASCN